MHFYSKAPKEEPSGAGPWVAARADCHRDAILQLAAVGAGANRMLVSCSRDTAVKVWK